VPALIWVGTRDPLVGMHKFALHVGKALKLALQNVLEYKEPVPVVSNPKARVTIKQVAHACNLSAPTVSQILNGKGWYREATKSAVIATAERLGYRPNGLAQAVQRGHLGLVALVLPW
jgi:hypothetical protein